jgi:hypothetical protein
MIRRLLLTDTEVARLDAAFSQAAAKRADSTMSKKDRIKRGLMTDRTARAPDHRALVNDGVHVFVDDQNLFWGITNDVYGKGYRMDFGRLLLETARGP